MSCSYLHVQHPYYAFETNSTPPKLLQFGLSIQYRGLCFSDATFVVVFDQLELHCRRMLTRSVKMEPSERQDHAATTISVNCLTQVVHEGAYTEHQLFHGWSRAMTSYKPHWSVELASIGDEKHARSVCMSRGRRVNNIGQRLLENNIHLLNANAW